MIVLTQECHLCVCFYRLFLEPLKSQYTRGGVNWLSDMACVDQFIVRKQSF